MPSGTVSCSKNPLISNQDPSASTHITSIRFIAEDDNPGPIPWLRIEWNPGRSFYYYSIILSFYYLSLYYHLRKPPILDFQKCQNSLKCKINNIYFLFLVYKLPLGRGNAVGTKSQIFPRSEMGASPYSCFNTVRNSSDSFRSWILHATLTGRCCASNVPRLSSTGTSRSRCWLPCPPSWTLSWVYHTSN